MKLIVELIHFDNLKVYEYIFSMIGTTRLFFPIFALVFTLLIWSLFKCGCTNKEEQPHYFLGENFPQTLLSHLEENQFTQILDNQLSLVSIEVVSHKANLIYKGDCGELIIEVHHPDVHKDAPKFGFVSLYLVQVSNPCLEIWSEERLEAVLFQIGQLLQSQLKHSPWIPIAQPEEKKDTIEHIYNKGKLIFSYIIAALLILFFILWIWQIISIFKHLEQPFRGEIILIITIFLLAFLIRSCVPDSQIIYPNFTGSRFHFIDLALAVEGSELFYHPNSFMRGLLYPIFYQMIFFVLPQMDTVFFAINTVMSALSVIFVYAIVRLLNGNWVWAMISSLSLCFFPLHIFYSATETGMVLSSFFALLSLMFILGYIRKPSLWMGLTAILSLALTVHSRILVTLFPGVILWLLIIYWKEIKVEIKKSQILIGSILLITLTSFQYFNLYYQLQIMESDGSGLFDRLLPAFKHFFLPNRMTLWNTDFTPIIIPLLMIAGLITLTITQWRTALFSIFLIYGLGVLYLYFNGTLYFNRYQYFVYPFFCIPVGAFVEWGYERIKHQMAKLSGVILFILILAVCFIPYYSFVDQPKTLGAEYIFIRETLPKLLDNTLIVFPDPYLIQPKDFVFRETLPDYLIRKYNIQIAPYFLSEALDKIKSGEINSSNLVVYFGLTSYVFDQNEAMESYAPDYFRASHNIYWDTLQLSPLHTTIIQNDGYSPAPGFSFYANEMEIGFYYFNLLS